MAATATVQLSTWQRIILVAVVLALAFGMVYYYFGVLLPIRSRRFQFPEATQGNWSDLYPRWLGARELLLHHRNPYSTGVTHDIQSGFYGRPLDPSRPGDPTDSEAFAYPVYVVFLLAPLVNLPFALVQTPFTCFLLLITMASVPQWMEGLNFSLRPWPFLLTCIAVMSSHAAIDGAHLQQLTLLVAFFLSASFAALSRGNMALAGVLLALATIKPQLVILVVGFLLLWAVSECHSRKWFLIGFVGTMALLLLASEILLPGWFRFWSQAAAEYARSHKPSAITTVLGQPLSTITACLGIFLCCFFFWRGRMRLPGSDRFNIAVIGALVLTELTIPNAGGGAFYNHILLIPSAVWLFTRGREMAGNSLLNSSAWRLAAFALAGQWLLALPVSLAALVLHHTFQREASLIVGGPELLAFLSPFALAFFMLSIARHLYRTA